MTRRLPAVAVFAFAFIAFVPNPALPIGSSTGVQAGQLLAIASVPAFVVLGSFPRRHTQVLLVLLAPVLLAGMVALLARRAFADDVVLNNVVATVLIMTVLIPAGSAVRAHHLPPLLCGAATAILANALLGLYQLYAFAQDVFPFPGLYQNPSFLSVISTDPNPWATYVKRPFGIFPEPSAMAASTGPFLVLFLALLLRRDLRARVTPRVRALLAVALVAGAALVVLARSGYAAFLMAGFLLVALPAIRDAVRRLHRLSGLLTVAAVVVVGVLVATAALSVLGARVESEVEGSGGESWPLRSASIVQGVTYLGRSVPDLLFGAGPGQSSLALESLGAVGAGLGGETGRAAVWSATGTYLHEAGLVGLAALVAALAVMVRAIARSAAASVGAVCLLAWFAGVSVTTSYLSLLPVWLFFAMLLGWDLLFVRGRGSHDDPRRHATGRSNAR